MNTKNTNHVNISIAKYVYEVDEFVAVILKKVKTLLWECAMNMLNKQYYQFICGFCYLL